MSIAETKVVNIYTESNPNPNSLKFVVNFMLMPEGVSRDYPDAESTSEAPLAKLLFDLPFVKRVFYMSNFVTVTKDDATDWYEVKGEVQQLIKNHLEGGLPILTEKEVKEDHQIDESDSDLEAKIKSILDEYIRPAVEMDGGAISFHSFDEGKVKVLLQGSCSGCPSSTVTLKAGIENLLKRMVPEVQEVEAEGV
ncbi:MAG: NifU family protein [Cyclobacteriaceae bacterium]|nr:NifU family protein [Cyclobacteriaceae bacterium HetDA_MAG_MS6]